MDVAQFKAVADALLKKHYGIDLADTPLADDQYVEKCIARNNAPFQEVFEHADECELARIDITGPYGTPSYTPLTARDEVDIQLSLSAPSRKVRPA